MGTYFDINTWPLYLLGFITFCSTLIDDVIRKKYKSGIWYLREFIYTLVSIAAGISISIGFELSKGFTWIIVILMGLCGSTLIRKIVTRKHKIINNGLNAIDERIQNEIKNGGKNEFK